MNNNPFRVYNKRRQEMVRTTVVAIAILACAAGALAADNELKWDNGSFLSGGGATVIYYGHDFDLTNYNPRHIKFIRIYSSGVAFNGQWDGFDVKLFDFTNGYPGELLWGPTFVIGSGTEGSGGFHWFDYAANFTLPAGKTKVVAVLTNHNPGPNVDPICQDNKTIAHHQWWLTGTQWAMYNQPGDLMIRLVVSDDVGVAPASLGRVKAAFK